MSLHTMTLKPTTAQEVSLSASTSTHCWTRPLSVTLPLSLFLFELEFKRGFQPWQWLTQGLQSESGIHPAVAMEEKKKGGLTEAAPQCELVDYKSLPAYLKDNQFILKYYRAEWPLKQTFLSIFSIHNETLNIWTSGALLILFSLYPLAYFRRKQ